MNKVYMIVGKYVVVNLAINCAIEGVKVTNKKVKEFKENRKLKEVKKGKKSSDYIDVEYSCAYC